MRSKMILDSQIKLAYHWRRIVLLRKKKALEDFKEEERIKAEKLAKKKNRKNTYGH